MYLEDAFAALHVWSIHHDLTIETTGPQERGIKHIRPVGGGDENDPFVGFEAVHFHQQLIERLLALVVATAQTGTAMTPHGVDFVDEDDARSVALALFKQVAHT
jgi:hypothetical protein